jgi:valyl-tRNA synthetase
MNDDGTMSEAAQLYIGEDRFDSAKENCKRIRSEGHLVKVEDYTNQIGSVKEQTLSWKIAFLCNGGLT